MQNTVAARNSRIAPFYVMEVMKAAAALEAQGRKFIHLSVGEPDFTAPPLVQEKAIAAIQSGRTQYTHAAGLEPLREEISQWYANRFGVAVPARRIFLTAGASGALVLACALLVEAGAHVLMPDPCYPCNKHFVAAADGFAQIVPTSAEQRFQLTARDVAQHWGANGVNTQGVLLASPSNPTGTSLPFDELKGILEVVREHSGFAIVDEIYLGLSYDAAFGQSALAADQNTVTINSFSKYFHMTGWRLGWMVVPEPLVAAAEKLAQNLFICPSSVAQHAALACFAPDSLAVYEERRAEFKRRRDFVVPALKSIGLDVPVTPDGAFYVYADCSKFSTDSTQFVMNVMQHAGVVLVPGRDFGNAAPERYFRMSYANSMDNLERALAQIRAYLLK
jgi:aspartate/methionine/tyrosine aminotransferase